MSILAPLGAELLRRVENSLEVAEKLKSSPKLLSERVLANSLQEPGTNEETSTESLDSPKSISLSPQPQTYSASVEHPEGTNNPKPT